MNTEHNLLDFQDPGTMNPELLNVPSFVNELKNYILAVAPRIVNKRLAAAVIWGSLFAAHVTRKMLYEAQFNVSEGKFDRLKKHFLGLLSKAGGEMDRSTLLKNMNIDSMTFQRIVLTLHMCDAIEEEMLSRRKTIYTLKTAA